MPEMPASAHFRANERVPTTLEVRLAAPEFGWEVTGYVVNLGLGGACLAAPRELGPGTTVTLRIIAPNLWNPMHLAGRIVWAQPRANGRYLAGVAFEHASGGSVLSLAELLSSEDFA